MDAKLLTAVGEALYGPHWPFQMSADLDMPSEDMRRMVAGEMAIPEDLVITLLKIVVGRIDRLGEVVELLEFAVERRAPLTDMLLS